jgi:hypothetical protein
MDREIERCRTEVAAIEAELLASNPDVAGLVLALSDWSAELRILQNEARGHHAEDSQQARSIGGGPYAGAESRSSRNYDGSLR